ncbi:MAG: hypothetical protein HRU13_05115, partial [Phycisphaerales bacterium]|nr:hypothetical protein [Phycisphaerales bacterium]
MPERTSNPPTSTDHGRSQDQRTDLAMSTIPESYPAAIDWCTDHLANWPADPT